MTQTEISVYQDNYSVNSLCSEVSSLDCEVLSMTFLPADVSPSSLIMFLDNTSDDSKRIFPST